MDTTALLSHLTNQCIQVRLMDGRLQMRGPLTDDLRATIRRNKTWILAALAEIADQSTPKVTRIPPPSNSAIDLPTARILLAESRTAGVKLTFDDGLFLEGNPSPHLAERIHEHAAGLIAELLIEQGASELGALASARAHRIQAATLCEAERAAIVEHDGGFPRIEAERAAREYPYVRCSDCTRFQPQNKQQPCAAGLTTTSAVLPRLCGHFEAAKTETATDNTLPQGVAVTCQTCRHNANQEWPELWVTRYSQFPERRAQLIWCRARDWPTSPEIDRRTQAPCGQWMAQEVPA